MDIEKQTKNYGAEHIQILEGIEAVRKRPGMYIGSTDWRGLNHLVTEIFDNAVDEALAGFGNKIIATLHTDGSFSIRDFGRGLPVDMHSSGVSAAEVIFTVLHAGGKFEEGVYKSSGGLHGVGASVVNAMSEWLTLEIHKDGYKYHAKFENGGHTSEPITRVGETEETGTLVHFKPDYTQFSADLFNVDQLKQKFKESAYLLKGIEIVFINEYEKQEDNLDVEEESHIYRYLFEGGILEYLTDLTTQKGQMHEVQYFEFKDPETQIEGDISFVWTEEQVGDLLYSFVNNVRTLDGGTHETGFRSSITRAVNNYANRENIYNKRLDAQDIRDGLVAVVSIRVPESLLQFEGQTKGKLGTSQAKPVVESHTYDALELFLNRNGLFTQRLITKAIETAKLREQQKKEREKLKKNKDEYKINRSLMKTLSEPSSKNRKERELFIVEGK